MIIGGIGYGLFGTSIKVGEENVARGLITFLVSITAVAIAIILTLAATVSRADELEKRISLGKEMLTALIGVLGTIVGFYFGKSSSEHADVPAPAAPPAVAAPGAPNAAGIAAKTGAKSDSQNTVAPGSNSPK